MDGIRYLNFILGNETYSIGVDKLGYIRDIAHPFEKNWEGKPISQFFGFVYLNFKPFQVNE